MNGKIQRLDFNGSSNLGAFCRVTDNWIIHATSNVPTKQALETFFEKTASSVSIGQSTLVGILTTGNSHGILVPHIILDEELELLQTNLKIPIVQLDSKLTALGNLILANDKAALVNPEFTKKERQVIQDTLNVEVEAGTLAGSNLVGSYCVVTNHGVLVHRDVSEEEIDHLASLFSVQADVGTINCGVPYISIGLLATSKAAAAGFETTGPELMRITEVFFS